jgi:hypothetical protein
VYSLAILKAKKHDFQAVIEEGRGGGAWVAIPLNVPEVFGTKGRVPVQATIDGVPYRGSVVPMGAGMHILGVKKDIRQSIGKDIGQKVRVTLERDAQERIVEVPRDLQAALNRDAVAKAVFETMSYTHRKEYVGAVEEARKPETRKRRIDKTLEMLRARAK